MTPKFWDSRVEEPIKRKKPTVYFVANTGDLMGEWVPDIWIRRVLDVIEQCPQHIFQLLTKNPKRYTEYEYPDNVWLGTSVTKTEDVERIKEIVGVACGCRFVSFEPLQGFVRDVSLKGIDWAIVGAESIGKSHIPKDLVQARKWAEPLIEEIDRNKIPLFIKPNLKPDPKRESMPDAFKIWKEAGQGKLL